MRMIRWITVSLSFFLVVATVDAQDFGLAPARIVPLPAVESTEPVGQASILGTTPLEAPAVLQTSALEASTISPLEAATFEPTSPAVAPPTIAPVEDSYPIDLATAVHLAGGQSLSVALAHEQAREAASRVRAADALWLPSIRVGLNYNKHEGVIQDVVGNAFNTSRGAFYNGLGAGAVGAGSPAYPGIAANFHLADALIQPLAARQTAAARRDASVAAMNDALLDGAIAYLELLARRKSWRSSSRRERAPDNWPT
ncbi:MAG: hypothetical protein QM775_27915 [Pirellulales bacterium]